jgi:tetratricopeptide (TPR) repeat protein
MNVRPLRAAIAAGVFLVVLCIYLRTLTPTVGLTDSGELTVAAWSLGNAHPPGFPFYLMLTHLVMLLPIGSLAWKANLASALFGAAACAVTSLAAGELLLAEAKANLDRVVFALVTALAGLLLAFSRTLWSYAVVAEVYALNLALLALLYLLVLAWRRTRSPALLYTAAVVFGLALGVHHATIVLGFTGIAFLVVRTAGLRLFRSRTLLITALLSVAALVAVYAYLPLAAAHKPPLNWGDPHDLGSVVEHITAKQYRQYISSARQGEQLSASIGIILRDLAPRWAPLPLLLAALGFIALFRDDRTLFWTFLLPLAATFAWSTIYPITNDPDAYLLPAILILVLAAASGAYTLVQWLSTQGVRRAVAGALLVLPIVAAVTAWPYRNRSRFYVAKDYADNALKPMGPNALLLTGDWQLYAPLFYFQTAEGVRQDVRAVEVGLLIRSWYLEQLARTYPQLIADVRPQFDAFRPWVDRWERTPPDQWYADAASRAEFYRKSNDLIVAMVTSQIEKGRPVYGTIDFVASREETLLDTVKRLTSRYGIVPRGVVIEYLPGQQIRPMVPVALQMRGLNDGTLAYESDDVVVNEIVPAYRASLVRQARYLAVARRYDEAVAEYRKALELDPRNPTIERELAVAASGPPAAK